jgi:hypothetical protein
MDPLLFNENEDVVLEVLAVIIPLSLIVDRGLSIVFGWCHVLEEINNRGRKEPIAFIISLAVVVSQELDCIAIIFSNESASIFWHIISAT